MEIHVGHDAANVGAADLVAISTAIPEHNAEVKAARQRDIPVLRRSDILPAISAERRTIVVAGTHGKTTTSSMLAMAMVEADLDPSFIIGGDVNEIGSGAVWSDGDWFVIEGDESDRTFLSLGAEIAIITNVEPDHLETYDNDPEQLLAAFVQFADAATTPIYCADDAGAMQVASAVPGITYGTAEHADYRMVDIATGRASVTFTIRHDGAEMARASCRPRACTTPATQRPPSWRRSPQVVRPPQLPQHSPGSVVSLAASSFGARSTVSPSSTTTPISRPRSKRRLPQPVTADGGGLFVSFSPIATAERQRCGRTSPSRSSRLTWSS